MSVSIVLVHVKMSAQTQKVLTRVLAVIIMKESLKMANVLVSNYLLLQNDLVVFDDRY